MLYRAATPEEGSSSFLRVTTIQLTGTGTDYQTVDGPIDMDLSQRDSRQGSFKESSLGPNDAAGQVGIWGTYVGVDFDICITDDAALMHVL